MSFLAQRHPISLGQASHERHKTDLGLILLHNLSQISLIDVHFNHMLVKSKFQIKHSTFFVRCESNCILLTFISGLKARENFSAFQSLVFPLVLTVYEYVARFLLKLSMGPCLHSPYFHVCVQPGCAVILNGEKYGCYKRPVVNPVGKPWVSFLNGESLQFS